MTSTPGYGDGVAQANVRNALTAELTVFTDNEQFAPASSLSAVLPEVHLADYPAPPASLVPGTVYVAVLAPTDVELSAVAGQRLYTIVEDTGRTDTATRFGVTAAAAGRPEPGRITGSTW